MKYSEVIEYKRKKRQEIQDRNKDYYQRIRNSSFSTIQKEKVFHKESGDCIGFLLGRKSEYIYVCMYNGIKIKCPDNIFNNLYEIHK